MCPTKSCAGDHGLTVHHFFSGTIHHDLIWGTQMWSTQRSPIPNFIVRRILGHNYDGSHGVIETGELPRHVSKGSLIWSKSCSQTLPANTWWSGSRRKKCVATVRSALRLNKGMTSHSGQTFTLGRALEQLSAERGRTHCFSRTSSCPSVWARRIGWKSEDPQHASGHCVP